MLKPIENDVVDESHAVQTTYGDIEEIHDDIELFYMKFKKFDVFESPPLDHHFNSSNMVITCSIIGQLWKSSLIKKITEEWTMVRSQVPSNVFIRVYEATMDSMRAAVIAEEDSSYHHGLFFFDIRFPKGYPSNLPQLFYHSFGESQCTKNFHQYGNVSLDLYSHWHNNKKKKNSNNSNVRSEKPSILEILVFIRQRVLMSIVTSGNPNSDSQGKKILMRTCGAMLRMLQSPPMGFEAFVVGYFRTRAHRILMNLKSTLDISTDMDMKLMFFRLVRAFEKNGTYCKHHYNQIQYVEATKEERNYVNPFSDLEKKVGCY